MFIVLALMVIVPFSSSDDWTLNLISMVCPNAVIRPTSDLDRWSLHDGETNTWRLDLAGWGGMPAETFGLRVGTERAVRARYPNGSPERPDTPGYSMESLSTFVRNTSAAPPIKDFFASPEDWPGVYWLDEPEGGVLPMSGENLGGTGRWYDSAGGGCSGRQAPFGYWCSDANSRGACPDDYFPHSQIAAGYAPDLGAHVVPAWSCTVRAGSIVRAHNLRHVPSPATLIGSLSMPTLAIRWPGSRTGATPRARCSTSARRLRVFSVW